MIAHISTDDFSGLGCQAVTHMITDEENAIYETAGHENVARKIYLACKDVEVDTIVVTNIGITEAMVKSIESAIEDGIRAYVFTNRAYDKDSADRLSKVASVFMDESACPISLYAGNLSVLKDDGIPVVNTADAFKMSELLCSFEMSDSNSYGYKYAYLLADFISTPLPFINENDRAKFLASMIEKVYMLSLRMSVQEIEEMIPSLAKDIIGERNHGRHFISLMRDRLYDSWIIGSCLIGVFDTAAILSSVDRATFLHCANKYLDRANSHASINFDFSAGTIDILSRNGYAGRIAKVLGGFGSDNRAYADIPANVTSENYINFTLNVLNID